MQEFLHFLRETGRQRGIVIGGVVLGVFFAMVFGLIAVMRPNFTPVYTGLTATSANSIEAALANAGFRVSVSQDGSTVLVPQSDTARARMMLAETGMPIDGDPGWELFDNQSGLAMNSFLQKINRKRAMEGELVRSIQTLDGISTARVHLVLPDREPFAREAPIPSASVILRPDPGRAVSQKQAIAVRNLVSSSVAELDLSRVTILSASGETILTEGSGEKGSATIQSTKSTIEDRLSQEIEDILTARVGAGNARVTVNADLTTHREVIVEQTFDPDQQVVRSTDSNSESQSGTERNGNVGVENNIPAALAPDGGGESSSRSENNETVRYEIGNTRREIVREAGDVRRLTVAVLVNGIYNVDGDNVVYSERPAEELKRLTELIKSAVGFEESRGDSVSVDSMRFMDYSMDLGEPITQSITSRLSENIVSIARGLIGLLIVVVIMLIGVRPLLRRLNEPPELTQSDAVPALADGAIGEGAASESQNSNTKAIKAAAAADGDVPLMVAEDHETIEKDGISGILNKRQIDRAQNLAEEKPEEVLRVLRSWLSSEAEA